MACAAAIRDLRSTLEENHTNESSGNETGNEQLRPGEHSAPSTTEEPMPPNRLPLVQTPYSGGALPSSSDAAPQHPRSSNTPNHRNTYGTSSFDLNSVVLQPSDLPEVMSGQSWLELGMDLEADLPMFPNNGVDPLQGFDIPFWMGQDNYAAWMGR